MTPPLTNTRGSLPGGSIIAGRYELVEPIAAGGMAQVWRGVDQLLSRPVAVKVMYDHLRHDAPSVERFRREAQASANLSHPNIVAIYDTVSRPEVDAIVMELVDGTTLRDRLGTAGPFDETEVIKLGQQVAGALVCAHLNGVVHRDIKPANILLASDGTVRLVDFGIAKAHEDPDLTLAGTLIGTAAYLSPEQVQGGVIDQRTDIYALGTVMYEAATGSVPFRGDSPTATALLRLHQDPLSIHQLNPRLSPAFCDVVMRSLQRAPERRFQSATALRTALEDIADAPLSTGARQPERRTGVVAAPSAPHPSDRIAVSEPKSRRQRNSRPRRSVIGRIALAVLLLAPIVLIVTLLNHESQQPAPHSPAPLILSTPVTAVIPYDPFGSGEPGENNRTASLAIDGKADTAWRTESYDNQKFGTKPGVGIVVNLDRVRILDHMTIQTSPGWVGKVYVSRSDLSQRAEPPDGGTDIAPTSATTKVDLQGERGSSVLIWVTDLGPATGRHRMELFDIKLWDRQS